MMYYIYEIKNNINNKTYIGQHKTNDLNDDYMGSGTILHQAYQKYGKKNFTKTILAVAGTKENINILEKVFIALYRSEGKAEYNIANGGDGGNLGEEVNKRISQKLKGKLMNSETKIKISNSKKGTIPWNKGKTGIYSEETRMKMGSSLRGKLRPQTEETIRKIKESKRFISDETREKLRKAQLGKHFSKESRMKMSESHKGQIPWNKILEV